MQFEWKQPLGHEECPYIHRWVFDVGLFSVRIHHWHFADDKRHYHDHPWWFLTFVVNGGYTDLSPAVNSKRDHEVIADHLKAGSIRFRKANHRHSVDVDDGGCWTVMLTGPVSQRWGFWIHNRKFYGHNKYFQKFGHPPCDLKSNDLEK